MSKEQKPASKPIAHPSGYMGYSDEGTIVETVKPDPNKTTAADETEQPSGDSVRKINGGSFRGSYDIK